MGYRGRYEIIADMLNVVDREAKKTRIMYQANLSYKLLKKYLVQLNFSRLITYHRAVGCYMLTAKGKEFLKAYKRYSKHATHLEKYLERFKVEEKILERLCPEL